MKLNLPIIYILSLALTGCNLENKQSTATKNISVSRHIMAGVVQEATCLEASSKSSRAVFGTPIGDGWAIGPNGLHPGPVAPARNTTTTPEQFRTVFQMPTFTLESDTQETYLQFEHQVGIRVQVTHDNYWEDGILVRRQFVSAQLVRPPTFRGAIPEGLDATQP